MPFIAADDLVLALPWWVKWLGAGGFFCLIGYVVASLRVLVQTRDALRDVVRSVGIIDPTKGLTYSPDTVLYKLHKYTDLLDELREWAAGKGFNQRKGG